MPQISGSLMSMYTIGRLARKFQLSRSTLLYYDRIGLLKPSGRTQAGYRAYSENDARRLEKICTYRGTGLPLADIRKSLNGPDSKIVAALENRLEELNADIQQLRSQQRLVVDLLADRNRLAQVGVMNKAQWVALLQASGFSHADMDRWHFEFERTAPDKHQEFLEFLCIPPNEIRTIRQLSRKQISE